ncbi:hypothetical protein CEXT_32661 [Caerostris extrusa]|uniref:Small EDRK-rich factor-like N-terminal domain-containing protein n=1 Tax=Caerostris extrusa TaxID=172846 RepID=A0AAV4SKU6_CAEEX|nr:hypothetical protein CEXT_32661 [Caerostris extrusa]
MNAKNSNKIKNLGTGKGMGEEEKKKIQKEEETAVHKKRAIHLRSSAGLTQRKALSRICHAASSPSNNCAQEEQSASFLYCIYVLMDHLLKAPVF